jgi:hypothetical protein
MKMKRVNSKGEESMLRKGIINDGKIAAIKENILYTALNEVD